MVGESCFECVGCKANVCLIGLVVIGGYSLLDIRLILQGTCRAMGICWVICSCIHCFKFSFEGRPFLG